MSEAKDEKGIAMNVADSAENLLDWAQCYANTQQPYDRANMLASMRIMVHRINKALGEMGETL